MLRMSAPPLKPVSSVFGNRGRRRRSENGLKRQRKTAEGRDFGVGGNVRTDLRLATNMRLVLANKECKHSRAKCCVISLRVDPPC
ncbi:hypothetical protein JOB18_004136 [Solea senegalensis]|uniref:Uncharacterized protein n=1 Tax=Solea senegalensis TaxID=28829 RepID=A0AAV6S299_SOLSE|nr:hypothetical protein JOB18_004136 [Solea senegalensis]